MKYKSLLLSLLLSTGVFAGSLELQFTPDSGQNCSFSQSTAGVFSVSCPASGTVVPPPPPPPPPPPSSCPPGTVFVAGTPAALGQGNGSFQVFSTQNQVTVFPFSVSGMHNLAYIKTTQNLGSGNVRELIISAKPCDVALDAHAVNIDGQAQVNVVPVGNPYAQFYTAVKTDGTIYYATIYNMDQNGSQTCQTNDCNFLITFNGS
jgi:hypothetical protein